jgi:hypothetical protein
MKKNQYCLDVHEKAFTEIDILLLKKPFLLKNRVINPKSFDNKEIISKEKTKFRSSLQSTLGPNFYDLTRKKTKKRSEILAKYNIFYTKISKNISKKELRSRALRAYFNSYF